MHHYLVILLTLFSDAGLSEADKSLPPETVAAVAQTVQTGSIIASRGDCLSVRVCTQSPYTHVGTVVVRDGQPYVYDSMIRIGVRCQPLAEYLESQRPCDIELFHPSRPFTREQSCKYEAYLKDQLGRPYAIRQYVTGREVNGLHCAEYLTRALIEADKIEAARPGKVSPAEILNCVAESKLYGIGHQANLPEIPVEPAPRAETWYGRAWQDTKSCSYGCMVQTRRWVLMK